MRAADLGRCIPCGDSTRGWWEGPRGDGVVEFPPAMRAKTHPPPTGRSKCARMRLEMGRKARAHASWGLPYLSRNGVGREAEPVCRGGPRKTLDGHEAFCAPRILVRWRSSEAPART